MKFTADFKEVEKFFDRLGSAEELETTLMTVTQNIARELHENLLKLTPVDTGNLRKSWSSGENLMFLVEKVNGGYEVTLVNKAQRDDGYKYGVLVNDGHSKVNGGWVMGRFFVENSISLTEQEVQAIANKELNKWFKRCLNG